MTLVQWYRTVLGQGRITGRRLDAPAPPLPTIRVAYGAGFYPTSLRFPNAGCREVTAEVGGAVLTFVTLVVEGTAGAPSL